MALPIAPLTGQPSIDYTRSRVNSGEEMDASGYCLMFVRQDFEVPSYYYSAIDAWNASTSQHPGDRNPPPGAPMFFHSSSVYRHVAYHLGDGQYATTYNEEIRQYGLSSMESIFGPVIGWTDDLNRYTVFTGASIPPQPTEPPWVDPWENFVRPWFIRRVDGAIVIVGPTGVRSLTADQWATYGNLGLAVFPPGMSAMDPAPFDQVVNSLGGIVD